MTQASLNPPWYVYLIRTAENKLYCGITNDLERRFNQHQMGKGAKALRGRGPLTLVWSQQERDKSSALKTEIAIKKLTKKRKEELVLRQQSFALNGME
ncbi:GIY-YIG nuclease family protein [Vibrio sp. SCSIO 43140]|uniref:GIY-YIG nuclease family protein n=1 Tax=Vibrio sp. SCSIO 43140 TaxID=2819100 RepID=UPI002074E290|nr:GIY-YIG nuclease family protein [Vibrio sp. SCSIO 43140]USD63773.1 GIY-YIG nuclease family protein [Vibrio sp. SCSIO 43140]